MKLPDMEHTMSYYHFRESNNLAKSSGPKRQFKRRVLTGFRLSLRLVKKTLCALCIVSTASTTWAQKSETDLSTKSLEELMNIEVTSVSKKEEKLFQTAAAVYVITQEEIRRSGMTSIPDLLRMVPGLNVARIDGTKWAISARGFNGRFADKLLVLIDGRSIYSPETSGVWWEVQDLMLEDIERIEVIRGPGGTIWGANAVNGVINIITRHAKETQGAIATAGGGTEARGLGSIRYGGKMGEQAHYRVYGKYFNHSGIVDQAGRDAQDGQEAVRGGGRVDWQLSDRDLLTLEGNIYRTNVRETPLPVSPAAPFAPHINMPGEFNGGDLLGRWTRTFSERSDMALQIYYDRFSRDIFDLAERNNTFDVDFQHHVAMGQRQDIVWGLGYRMLWDGTDTTSSTPVQYYPKAETAHLFSAFAQDEFTLVRDRLRLILGSKIEMLKHKSDGSSNFDVQPSIRLLWTPQSHQTVWGAISRAVKTPARNDRNIRVNVAAFPGPGGTPAVVALFGDPNYKSEKALSYEAGYRVQPGGKLSLDIATFYNSYDRLTTLEPARPFFETDPLPPHVIIPLVFSNLMRGKTYGAETSVNLNVNKAWRLAGSYSLLRTHLHRDLKSLDTSSKEAGEGSSPQHQFQLHSYLRLPSNFELDASLYHVSRLAYPQVPGYARLDVRLGWRLAEGVEISAVGQNLLDGRHPEFAGNDIGVRTSQAKRSAYGKITWQF
jgi:iron complex outermembrane recepter protein